MLALYSFGIRIPKLESWKDTRNLAIKKLTK